MKIIIIIIWFCLVNSVDSLATSRDEILGE